MLRHGVTRVLTTMAEQNLISLGEKRLKGFRRAGDAPACPAAAALLARHAPPAPRHRRVTETDGGARGAPSSSAQKAHTPHGDLGRPDVSATIRPSLLARGIGEPR